MFVSWSLDRLPGQLCQRLGLFALGSLGGCNAGESLDLAKQNTERPP